MAFRNNSSILTNYSRDLTLKNDNSITCIWDWGRGRLLLYNVIVHFNVLSSNKRFTLFETLYCDILGLADAEPLSPNHNTDLECLCFHFYNLLHTCCTKSFQFSLSVSPVLSFTLQKAWCMSDFHCNYNNLLST